MKWKYENTLILLLMGLIESKLKSKRGEQQKALAKLLNALKSAKKKYPSKREGEKGRNFFLRLEGEMSEKKQWMNEVKALTSKVNKLKVTCLLHQTLRQATNDVWLLTPEKKKTASNGVRRFGFGFKNFYTGFGSGWTFLARVPGSKHFYRSSVNEVGPPHHGGGGPFTSPLVVIKKFQTEIWSGPPPTMMGGANFIY